MALKERITEDMKSAMRAGDKDRLGTIRLALAAIKQREVDERVSLDDAQVLAVLEKMIKQRHEATPGPHLRQQLGRRSRRRGGHQDRVVGRTRRPALRAVCLNRLDRAARAHERRRNRGADP